MTPATKQKSPSAELRKLQEIRDRLHAKVREAKRNIGAYEETTQAKRAELTERQSSHPEEFTGNQMTPRPDTYAAKLIAEIRERMAAPNPHQPEYDEAFGPYEKADLALQAFKRERVFDRIAEVTGDVDAGAIRSAWEQLRRGLEHYRVEIEEVRSIILDTPGLNGQALEHDGRIEGWYGLALEALASDDIGAPGLTYAARLKAERWLSES